MRQTKRDYGLCPYAPEGKHCEWEEYRSHVCAHYLLVCAWKDFLDSICKTYHISRELKNTECPNFLERTENDDC